MHERDRHQVAAAGIAGRSTIARSMPADLGHRAAPGRSASRSRPCGTCQRSAAAVQQARSIGSVGLIRQSQGFEQPVADQDHALVEAPEHERPAAPCQRPPMIIVSIRLR